MGADREHRWLWLILALAFLFRLAPLGRYVTPDEPAWVYRSLRFADGLYDPFSGGRLPIVAADGTRFPDGRFFLPVEVAVE